MRPCRQTRAASGAGRPVRRMPHIQPLEGVLPQKAEPARQEPAGLYRRQRTQPQGHGATTGCQLFQQNKEAWTAAPRTCRHGIAALSGCHVPPRPCARQSPSFSDPRSVRSPGRLPSALCRSALYYARPARTAPAPPVRVRYRHAIGLAARPDYPASVFAALFLIPCRHDGGFKGGLDGMGVKCGNAFDG